MSETVDKNCENSSDAIAESRMKTACDSENFDDHNIIKTVVDMNPTSNTVPIIVVNNPQVSLDKPGIFAVANSQCALDSNYVISKDTSLGTDYQVFELLPTAEDASETSNEVFPSTITTVDSVQVVCSNKPEIDVTDTNKETTVFPDVIRGNSEHVSNNKSVKGDQNIAVLLDDKQVTDCNKLDNNSKAKEANTAYKIQASNSNTESEQYIKNANTKMHEESDVYIVSRYSGNENIKKDDSTRSVKKSSESNFVSAHSNTSKNIAISNFLSDSKKPLVISSLNMEDNNSQDCIITIDENSNDIVSEPTIETSVLVRTSTPTKIETKCTGKYGVIDLDYSDEEPEEIINNSPAVKHSREDNPSQCSNPTNPVNIVEVDNESSLGKTGCPLNLECEDDVPSDCLQVVQISSTTTDGEMSRIDMNAVFSPNIESSISLTNNMDVKCATDQQLETEDQVQNDSEEIIISEFIETYNSSACAETSIVVTNLQSSVEFNLPSNNSDEILKDNNSTGIDKPMYNSNDKSNTSTEGYHSKFNESSSTEPMSSPQLGQNNDCISTALEEIESKGLVPPPINSCGVSPEASPLSTHNYSTIFARELRLVLKRVDEPTKAPKLSSNLIEKEVEKSSDIQFGSKKRKVSDDQTDILEMPKLIKIEENSLESSGNNNLTVFGERYTGDNILDFSAISSNSSNNNNSVGDTSKISKDETTEQICDETQNILDAKNPISKPNKQNKKRNGNPFCKSGKKSRWRKKKQNPSESKNEKQKSKSSYVEQSDSDLFDPEKIEPVKSQAGIISTAASRQKKVPRKIIANSPNNTTGNLTDDSDSFQQVPLMIEKTARLRNQLQWLMNVKSTAVRGSKKTILKEKPIVRRGRSKQEDSIVPETPILSEEFSDNRKSRKRKSDVHNEMDVETAKENSPLSSTPSTKRAKTDKKNCANDVNNSTTSSNLKSTNPVLNNKHKDKVTRKIGNTSKVSSLDSGEHRKSTIALSDNKGNTMNQNRPLVEEKLSSPRMEVKSKESGSKQIQTQMKVHNKETGSPKKRRHLVVPGSEEHHASVSTSSAGLKDEPVSKKLYSAKKVKTKSSMGLDTLIAAGLKKMSEDSTKEGKKNQMQCFMCDKTFRKKSKLKKHFKRHIMKVVRSETRPKKSYKCYFCSEKLHSRHAWKKHIKSKHSKNDNIKSEYICGTCSEEFSSIVALNVHQQIAHPISETDEASDSSEEELVEPKSKPITAKTVKFQENEYVKDDKKHSLNHKKASPLEYKTKIVFSEEKMDTSCDSSLDAATEQLPETSDPKLTPNDPADETTLQTVHKQRIEATSTNHMSNGKFQCQQCSKRFSTSKGLKIHERYAHSKSIVTAESATSSKESFTNDYKCPKCSKVYGRLNALIAHDYKIHRQILPEEQSGDSLDVNSMRNHPCPKCSKVYPTYRAMYDHYQEVHKRSTKAVPTESLPKTSFPCKQCSKCFSTLTLLTSHKCISQSSPESKCLTESLPNKGSGDIHSCNQCPKKFSSFIGLQIHQRRSHGVLGQRQKVELASPLKNAKPITQKPRENMAKKPSKGKELFCYTCFKRFQTSLSLSIHNSKEHSSESLQSEVTSTAPVASALSCPICFQELSSVSELVSHVQLQHPD